MSRKPAAGKSARPSSASVALRPDEAPLLPEMPPFFPDPVALDAEDRHLVALRDALFQREYERSAKALLCHAQTQMKKRGEKQAGRRSGSDTLSPPCSASAETQGREATRTLLSPLPPEPVSEATPEHLITTEKKDLAFGGRTLSLSISKGPKKGVATEETIEHPRIVNITGASTPSVPFPNEENEMGKEVTSKKEKTLFGVTSDGNEFKIEGEQDQEQNRSGTPITAPELPIYLTQPMPPSLITLAEEVGMANASLETCDVVMNILKAQDQHGGSIIPLLCPVLSAETAPELRKTLETASAIAQSTFSSGSQRGRQSIAISPIHHVSTFPLIGALVLEAEQQIAVEMFCEDICEEIVSLAAESYVSRYFDALATSYTAYSVWDELHDNVVRSFVPHDPGIPRSLEVELNSALAIRQGKNNKSKTENVVQGKNAITQTKYSVNASAPYFGMLPIWTSTPSLLSADAILSFHQKATVAPKVFSGKVVDGTSYVIRTDKEIEKPNNIVGRRPQSSTFSRLLAASMHGGEKRQAVNGVIVTVFSPSGKSKEAWRATGFTIEEDENSPGAPPDAIPLDDYARYVIPKSEDVLKKKKEEEEEKKNQEEVSGRRKVQRRRVSRKSQTTVSIHNSNYRKEGEGEIQNSISPHGLAHVGSGISTDYSASQQSKGSKRRGKRIQQDLSDGVSLSVGGSTSTRPVSPEFIGDDNWTKALRHLPRGYLSMVGNSSHTTSARNQTMETLVLIEGGNAVTVASNVKKQRITSADNDSTKDSKKSRSLVKSLSPTTRGTTISDEQKTTLQVSINNAGTVSFNAVRRSITTSTGTQNCSNTPPPRIEKNNQQKQQQAQTQKQDSPKRVGKTRGDGYIFLSRKEQRRLEERMRRQKEAAEQAAYESMFFTASQTIVSTSAETAENAGGSPDAQKPPQAVKIVPEPGVLVEQWSNTSPERNNKSGVAMSSKSRYRRGKEVESTNQQIHSEKVVVDGGEWILPDGKYRWSSFDPTNREKTAVTATPATVVAAAAAVTRPIASLPTERESISQRKNTGEVEDKKDEGSPTRNKESQSVNITPSGMFPKPVVRPIRRAPPMIISAKKEKEKLKEKHEKQKGGADKEMSEKGKTVNMKRHRSAKNVPMRVTLPRLPSKCHHSSSDDEIPSGRRNLKTPSAIEENKIRLLASILQNSRGTMD
ncbi:hypothetical protein LSM04_005336 [Trypanosoma melophagium]|uniref:uncharacterized protein n=1 Tax=Trypanosoma melophagium TaxID=715481 RepID=UPI00351A7348|nr:hypothetical protein LSM04_005336 [Trypanosoma melophagium]